MAMDVQAMVFDIIAKDHASGTFTKVALNSRLLNESLNDVSSNAAGLAKLALAPSLIPTLAVAAANTGSLVTALTAAAGAGGIFAASVVGAVKDMKEQQKGIATTQKKLDGMDKSSKDYGDTLAHLRDQQKAFNEEFGPAAKGLDHMKIAWAKFLEATRPTTTKVMAKSMNLVASILPKLVPVSNAAGKAIGGLVDDLAEWAASPGFDRLLHFFKTSGAADITRFGHMVGNVFVGLGGIMKNFIGPGDKVAASLEKLTAKFAKWGNSKGVSASVQKFLDYSKENGPKVADVLGQLVHLLPQLVGSFASMGSISLAGASGFLDLLSGLPPSVFNAIATSLFGIAAAIKVIRLVTAAWATVQWAIDAALAANPIALVVIALAAMAAGLIYAYKHSETFRDIVNGVFDAVGKACFFLWDKMIRPYFKLIIGLWLSVVGALVNGAAKAFGWVPGLGPKLKAAAEWFNTFKDQVNDQLDGVHKNIKITADTSDARTKIRTLDKLLNVFTQKKREVHVNVVEPGMFDPGTTKPRKHSAVGGRWPAFTPLRVGEGGGEDVMFPVESMVMPHNRSRGGGGSGGDTFVINVDGGLDSADAIWRRIEAGLRQLKKSRGWQPLTFEQARA